MPARLKCTLQPALGLGTEARGLTCGARGVFDGVGALEGGVHQVLVVAQIFHLQDRDSQPQIENGQAPLQSRGAQAVSCEISDEGNPFPRSAPIICQGLRGTNSTLTNSLALKR